MLKIDLTGGGSIERDGFASPIKLAFNLSLCCRVPYGYALATRVEDELLRTAGLVDTHPPIHGVIGIDSGVPGVDLDHIVLGVIKIRVKAVVKNIS